MIQVQELLQLTLFDDFTLIAGAGGLTNEMEGIVILEYESYKNTYEVFHKKDFVLSSLFFAKDDPALIEDALMNLLRRDVAGIAVKTVFFHELPETVKAAANRRKIPIFLFESAFMEDLIISANDLLKSKLQYLVFEEKLTQLLEREPYASHVAETAREINPFFREQMITAYLTPKDTLGQNTVSEHFQRLLYKRYQQTGTHPYSYVKYRQGMFLLYSFDGASIDPHTVIAGLLKKIDLDFRQFDIGIADAPRPREELHILLEQAVCANRICQLQKADSRTFSSLMEYQFLAPLLAQPALRDNYQSQLARLKEYDALHSSELLETLAVYVAKNGEIAAAAEALFQHPNTIRYRVRKACTILGCPEDGFYGYAYMLMKLYQLEQGSRI